MSNSTLSAAITAIDRVEGRPLRAVDYLRVSTEEQTKGYGISAGAKKTAAYIAKKGWTYVDTFKDEGVSGSLEADERDDLKRLMQLARQEPRPFDVVVVPETRVIGRTDRAFWRWVWELQEIGIFVAIANKNIDNTTPEGEEAVREEANYAFKEYTRIRVRTQSGLQEKAEEGGYTGGVVPYGYRIENKGKKGESRLVLDTCDCVGQCGSKHEYDFLHSAWHLLVVKHKNGRQAAIELNAEGYRNRDGGLWTGQNVLSKFKSLAIQESKIIFRNPDHAGRKSGTKLGMDGKPLHGGTVIITLAPVFTQEELRRLNQALARNSRRRTSSDELPGHPLSKRIFGACGAYYTGLNRTDRSGRMYRCSGKMEEFPGAPRCSCSQIDADAVEQRVWGEVRKLLADPDRLTTMSQDWIDVRGSQKVDHEKRIADLKDQIEAQDEAIAAAVVVAAKNKQSSEAIGRAIAKLQKERTDLESLLKEAIAWRDEAEYAQQRAHDLQALAEMAREGLPQMTAAEQAEVMDLIDIKVTLTGEVPKKVRKDDTLTAWFRSNKRGVPVLDDAGWLLVEGIFKSAEVRKLPGSLSHRTVLEAILHKARAGITWSQLPDEYGKTTSITTRYQRWVASGVWEEAMAALSEVEATPLPAAPYPLPPLLVEGQVDPRLLFGVLGESQEMRGSARVTSQGNSMVAVIR
ncbi:recombinase family protein [Streptomyces olivoreticuli]